MNEFGEQAIGKVLKVKEVSAERPFDPLVLTLDDLKRPPDELPGWDFRVVSQAYKNALDILGRYLPVGLPVEPTEFIVRLGRIWGNSASYEGKLEGRHYVEVDMDDSSLKVIPLRVTIHIIHELLHQRTAEFFGQRQYRRYELNTFTTEEELSKRKVSGVIHDISCRRGARGWWSDDFVPVITEGIATLGEIFIVNKMIEEERRLPSNDYHQRRLKFLEGYRGDRLRFLEGRMDEQKRYSLGVLKIMRRLYRRFGLENLPEIIKHIDLGECAKIKIGSERYQKILENVRLIPGLEKMREDAYTLV